MSCKHDPTTLKIVTDDPKLYSGKWYWHGDLFYSVNCTSDNQIDNTAVPQTKFVKLETTPSEWDFCNNNNCSYQDNFIIIFTFNPESNNANDYLQYLINYNKVLSKPTNQITDSNNQQIQLDIENVSSLNADKLVEVWLSRGVSKGTFNPSYSQKSNRTVFTVLYILGGLLLFGLLLAGGRYLVKNINFQPKQTHNIL